MNNTYAVAGFLLTGPLLLAPSLFYMADCLKKSGVPFMGGKIVFMVDVPVKYCRLLRGREAPVWPMLVYAVGIVLAGCFAAAFFGRA